MPRRRSSLPKDDTPLPPSMSLPPMTPPSRPTSFQTAHTAHTYRTQTANATSLMKRRGSISGSFSSDAARSNTSVYVRDSLYAWLPAHLVSTDEESHKATVTLALPDDWMDCTVIPPSSDLELDYFDERKTDRASRFTRTVDLREYPNGELPLQNLDGDGALLEKRDMADLHFLHEAAILYNLKERHRRGVPYTRVGDIVVAMNPFRWINGLYSSEKQGFYAEHLIWNVKEEEEDDDYGNEIKPTPSVEIEHSDRTSAISSRDPLSHGAVYDKLGYDPHVYETSCLAYRGLSLDGINQTILVSGESGAGKTETVKIVMGHLATVEQTRPFFKYTTKSTGNQLGPTETVRRVLESNPVFEAFGNAKTIRNDNSSRFGKFTQLQFDVEDMGSAKRGGRDIPCALLAGSACTTYLLEKSRVVSHSEGERTYHILYQLLSASEEYKGSVWEGLLDTDNESFRYVGFTEIDNIEGHSDGDTWVRTKDALSVFNFEGDSLRDLMRALCTVLQLGNLTFDLDPASEIEEGCSVITSRDELLKLSDLMGVDGEIIEAGMTTRRMKTRYDDVTVHLRPNEARDGCDALAKEIYARVFDLLVRKINDYTMAERHYVDVDNGGNNGGASTSNRKKHRNQPKKKFGLISLLDIFGFECFTVNRFEQLCINYANERLQQKYVLDNFKAVQKEYEAEGIEIFDFAVVDNSDVLTLLEGRMGLIIALNEECIRPKGSDASFVYKAKMVHSDSTTLIQEKLHRDVEFGINHFAGPVTYDATKFVERNTDKLPKDLMDTACLSTNSILRTEFKTLANDMDKSTKAGIRKKSSMITSHTVMTKFKTQLASLMDAIEDTRTRYIRCIKPNDTMDPQLTDHHATMRQLECAGLVTAITISRESFPNRLGYAATMDRFACLVMGHKQRLKMERKGADLKEAVKGLLSTLLRPMSEVHRDGTVDYPFACGKTRVYFRAGALERLETDRMEYFTIRSIVLQRWVRKVVALSKYTKFKYALVVLQSQYRSKVVYKEYNREKYAVLVMQCWIRCLEAKWKVKWIREYNAAVWIQTRWRSKKPKTALQKFKMAAAVIQRAIRKRKNQSNFTAKLAVCVEEARMDNKLSHLQQQVEQCAEVASVNKLAASTASLASVGGGGVGEVQTVDEKLLEEIETMFDYLRKEIYTLRGKNSDLRAELRDADTDKRDLLAHAEAAEAASSLSRLRVSQLTKTNTALITEVMEHKNDVTTLKKELRSKQSHNQEDVAALKEQFERALEERDNEIAMVRQQLKSTRAAQKFETDMLKDELAKAEEDHVAEVLRYKDELRRTQDSHHDYLAKLMDVLETTHAARESETARINGELQQVREEKDRQIVALQREVSTLRRMHSDEARGMSKEVRKKNVEIASMKTELERNSSVRSHRTQKFHQIADQLEHTVDVSVDSSSHSSGGGDGVRHSLLGRKKSRQSASGHSPEDFIRMKKMVRSLRDLYELESTTHAKVDEDTLHVMENFVVVANPDATVTKLRDQLEQKEEENESLQKQLEEQFVCRACEFRKSRGSRARGGDVERRSGGSGGATTRSGGSGATTRSGGSGGGRRSGGSGGRSSGERRGNI